MREEVAQWLGKLREAVRATEVRPREESVAAVRAGVPVVAAALEWMRTRCGIWMRAADATAGQLAEELRYLENRIVGLAGDPAANGLE